MLLVRLFVFAPYFSRLWILSLSRRDEFEGDPWLWVRKVRRFPATSAYYFSSIAFQNSVHIAIVFGISHKCVLIAVDRKRCPVRSFGWCMGWNASKTDAKDFHRRALSVQP